jgi:hypothetical protein
MSAFKDPRIRNFIVIAVSVYFCTRVFNVNTGHILAFLLCAVIIWKIQQEEDKESMDFNTTLEYQLQTIGNPSHFHWDTDLVRLFFNLLPWRKLNANNYDTAIEAVNSVIRIEDDTNLTTEHCVNNYDVAFDKAKLAMNLVHGFVYSIEHPQLVKKLKLVLTRLQLLLEKHLDIIRGQCKFQEEQKGTPNVHSRYIEDAKTVKPLDPSRLSPFDFY